MVVKYGTMPAKQNGQPFHMLYENELMKEIENFRYENRIPSRAETIKALVRLGLTASKGEKRGKAAPK